MLVPDSSDIVVIAFLVAIGFLVAWLNRRRQMRLLGVLAGWQSAGKTVFWWPRPKPAASIAGSSEPRPGRWWLLPTVFAVAISAFSLFFHASISLGLGLLALAMGLGNPFIRFGQGARLPFTDEELFWLGQTYRWEDMERSDYSDGTVVYRYRKSSIACISAKATELVDEPWDRINPKLRFVQQAG